MKSLIIVLLVSLLLPLSPTLSGACSGVKFDFKWKEPKTNIDGTALTDLQKTTLYYISGNATVVKKDYAATKAAGGGSKTAAVTIPAKCGTAVSVIKVWTTATNTVGESASSNVLNYVIPVISPAQASGGL